MPLRRSCIVNARQKCYFSTWLPQQFSAFSDRMNLVMKHRLSTANRIEPFSNRVHSIVFFTSSLDDENESAAKIFANANLAHLTSQDSKRPKLYMVRKCYSGLVQEIRKPSGSRNAYVNASNIATCAPGSPSKHSLDLCTIQ